MFRSSLSILKVSPVSVPAVIGSLSYTSNYKKKSSSADFELAKRFTSVNEDNRYEALRVIFWEKLAGSYVGRRQYKLNTPDGPTKERDKQFLQERVLHGANEKVRNAVLNLSSSSHTEEGGDGHDKAGGNKNGSSSGGSAASIAAIAERERLLNPFTLIVPRLIKEHLDWHDLKGLNRIELLDLMRYLQLNASDRVIFLSAIESKMCGVLTKSGKDRRPGTLCTRPGKECFGWRCGESGHVANLYFEGKAPAPATTLGAPKEHGFLSLNPDERQLYLNAIYEGKVHPTSSSIIPNFTELIKRLSSEEANQTNLPNPTRGTQQFPNALSSGSPNKEEQPVEQPKRSQTARFVPSTDDLNPFSQRATGDRHDAEYGGGVDGTTTSPHHTASTSSTSYSKTVRMDEEFGIQLDVRSMPDFSVVGRLEGRIQPNPRIWSTPANPIFEVHVMGFEFRVHPDDPRAAAQIEQVVDLWSMHGGVVKAVLWEMLELYAVERPTQPLVINAGELGEPDDVYSFSSAFISKKPSTSSAHTDTMSGTTTTATDGDTVEAKDANLNSNTSNSDSYTNSNIIADEDVVIERRILQEGDDEDVDGGSTESTTTRTKYAPWFRTPLPQPFSKGVPDLLPFAPTIVIQASFKPMMDAIGFHTADDKQAAALEERYLHYPLLDVSILVHPDCCFWWSPEDEEKALEHVLAYAKKVPFAIPFNLYLRVDKCRELYGPVDDVLSKRELLDLKKRVASTEYVSAEVHTPGGDDDSKSSSATSTTTTKTYKELLDETLGNVSRRTIFNIGNFREMAKRQVNLSSSTTSVAGESHDGGSAASNKMGYPIFPSSTSSANSAASILQDIDVDVDDMMFPDVNPDGWE